MPRQPTLLTPDLAEIVRLAERGHLRIPEFHRPFNWGPEDVRRLFDSIWRGIPIGSLVWWRHPGEAGRSSFGDVAFDVPASDDVYWSVDGHQRLAALIGVLSAEAGKGPRPGDVGVPLGVSGLVPSVFNLWVDLRRGRLVHLDGQPRPGWVPLRVLLTSSSLMSWLRSLDDDLAPDELDRADVIGSVLRSYRLVVSVIEAEDDLLARDAFRRINSTARSLRRTEALAALFHGAGGGDALDGLADALTERGFGRLDREVVEWSLQAIRGGPGPRPISEEFGPDENDEERAAWLERTGRALELTVDFLKTEGVPHYALVPLPWTLPVLAAFFHLHPHPDPWNRRLLARWLWRVWVAGNTVSPDAAQSGTFWPEVHLINPEGQEDGDVAEYDAASGLLGTVPDEPAIDRLRFDAMSPRLWRLAYSEQRPVRDEAKVIQLRELLGFRDTAFLLMALASLTPRSPDGDLVNVPARLSGFQEGERAGTPIPYWPHPELPTGDELPSILASHAIDGDASLALRAGEQKRFWQLYDNAVWECTLRFLTAKTDPGGIVRPPLADLFVPDDEDE